MLILSADGQSFEWSDLPDDPDLSGYATISYVDFQIAEAVDGLATEGYVDAGLSAKADIAGWTASRVLTSDGSGNLVASAITTTQLGYVGIATPGVVQASRAVVVDANKDAGGFRRLGIGVDVPAVNLHLQDSTVDSNVLCRIQNDARIWQLGVFGSTSDIFAIRDQTGSTNPFVIEAGTPANTLWIDNASGGGVGVGNNNPQAKLHVSGTLIIQPGSSVTPPANGQIMWEATNNTTITVKLRGSDGTVRSGTIALS